MKRSVFFAAFLLVMVGGLSPSHAQLNNQPYQPFAARAGFGMSTAYRQALLNQKLRGQRPDNLARSASGALLEISRFGGRAPAFVSVPSDAFLPGAGRQGGLGLSGLGWRLASYTGSVGIGYSRGTALPGEWITMLDAQPVAANWSGTAGDGISYSAIDSWIGQLPH
ncbi:hypothetical protein [Thalassobaculum sp.]|uniref:hypothetical protein n=1 Tax=Thalassobaculum sp. TaxID=2022740 RepID=UPI0032EFF0CB